MTRPVRLQLSRKKGFNLQRLSMETNGLPAVNVARPNKWGNPFAIGEQYRAVDDAGRSQGQYTCRSAAEAKECFGNFMQQDQSSELRCEATTDLRGRNLACWCAPGAPCHADVLLELANPKGD